MPCPWFRLIFLLLLISIYVTDSIGLFMLYAGFVCTVSRWEQVIDFENSWEPEFRETQWMCRVSALSFSCKCFKLCLECYLYPWRWWFSFSWYFLSFSGFYFTWKNMFRLLPVTRIFEDDKCHAFFTPQYSSLLDFSPLGYKNYFMCWGGSVVCIYFMFIQTRYIYFSCSLCWSMNSCSSVHEHTS